MNARRAELFAIVALLGVMLAPIGCAAQSAGSRDSFAGLQASVQNSIAQLDRSLIAVVAIGQAGPMVVGTGFFVSDDGTFVTAHHVLQQGPGIGFKILMRTKDAPREAAGFEVIARDAMHDIVVCRAALEKGVSTVPVKLAAASESVAGTFVVISGFPLTANSPSSHLGIVSSNAARSDPLELAAFVNEGESGAPILRIEDGQVIGMVSSVRTASTYKGAGRGIEDQNSGLTLGMRSELLAAAIARSATARP